jgi:hypothetical protein
MAGGETTHGDFNCALQQACCVLDVVNLCATYTQSAGRCKVSNISDHRLVRSSKCSTRRPTCGQQATALLFHGSIRNDE